MKFKFLKAVTLSFTLIVSSFTAMAGIIEGTLYNAQSTNGSTRATTFDLWYFTVNNDSNVIFDILSWEATGWSSGPVDHNGDGEFAFFDSYLLLFNDDGNLGAIDYIMDDDDGGLGADGSTYGYDSYLNSILTAGNYVVAVTTCCSSASDLDYVNGIQNYGTLNHIDSNGDFSDSWDAPLTHGDYRLTYSGDMTLTNPPSAVPEPSTLAILALGLMGLASLRFKKQS